MNIAVTVDLILEIRMYIKEQLPSLGNGSEKTIIHWCMAEENPG